MFFFFKTISPDIPIYPGAMWKSVASHFLRPIWLHNGGHFKMIGKGTTRIQHGQLLYIYIEYCLHHIRDMCSVYMYIIVIIIRMSLDKYYIVLRILR
jgi:hypothetical protein